MRVANLDAIYITAHYPDVYLVKILCQSIRYFCDSIPIIIIKDGSFDLTQLTRQLGVQEFDDRQLPDSLHRLKGIHGKFKPFFQTEHQRYLFLDADIVLLSDPRLLPFENYDFYVEGGIEDVSNPITRKRVSKLIFDVDKMQDFDPDFDFSDFLTFNSGQHFATAGMMNQDLLLNCIRESEYYSQDPIFKYGDQGIMNYILNKMRHQGIATVGASKFAIFPSWEPEVWFPELTYQAICERTYKERALIHYTGPTRKFGFWHTTYQWVPHFFQKQYYKSLPIGTREYEFMTRFILFWKIRLGHKLKALLSID